MLYVDFTVEYAAENTRGTVVSCSVTKSASSTNYASNCQYMSKRRISITFGTSDSANMASAVTYTVQLLNLNTPIFLPSYYANQMRVALFLANLSQ
jgi:hypothetical protein